MNQITEISMKILLLAAALVGLAGAIYAVFAAWWAIKIMRDRHE